MSVPRMPLALFAALPRPASALRGQARRSSLWSIGLLAVLIGIAPQARADFFADNEARRAILDLRQRYLALSEENNKLRESLKTTQSQLESLRGEVSRIRNREEQQARELTELQKRLNQSSAEDRAGSTLASQATPAATAGAAAEAPLRAEDAQNEKAAFDAALNKFRSNDYAGAQAGLQGFLQKHPRSSRRIAALYWLGNADYALRNYRNAMRSYRAVVAQAPQHERAPEALLALSACQVELQDTAGARATLEKLIKTYPRSEAAQAAQDRLTRLR